jgi:hypothetical protein
MEKTAAAAAGGLVTVAALTGAGVQAGFATADSAPEHTKRYVLKLVDSAELGETAFAAAARMKSKRTGEVVGYENHTGRWDPDTGDLVLNVGMALRGGVLVARLKPGKTQQTFVGPILKGSGKYAGIDGSIRVHPEKGTSRTIAVLRYRL